MGGVKFFSWGMKISIMGSGDKIVMRVMWIRNMSMFSGLFEYVFGAFLDVRE